MAVTSNFSSPYEPGLITDLQGSGFETSLSGIPYTTQDTGDGFGIMSGTSLTTSRSVINTFDLISEGEIEGLVSGEYVLSGSLGSTGYTSGNFTSYGDFPENQLRSIYLNETPITSEGANGKNYYNFQNYKYAISDGDARGIGDNDDFLLSADALKTQKSRTINERIYGPENDGTIYPKSYRVYNSNLKSFVMNIKIPALSYVKAGSMFTEDEINQQVGTSIGFNVQYRALYKDGTAGGWETDITSSNASVSGLMSNPYLFDITTTPNQGDTDVIQEILIGWEFQITRTTLDSINAFVKNESYLESVTEVLQSSLSYPNSVIIGSKFDAEFFSQIPNRAFDVKLLKVQIPSNYDPIHKIYTGDWSGTFKSEKYWTDNPAWIFYDLVTNKRYGLGKYIESISVDKWSLYKIAQYCDVLVDDGQDGVEPRFSANVYVNSREEAFKVLQDFASIFRGILYYGLGTVNAIQDSERQPVIQFTNANVEEGDFSYSSTAKKTRFSVAVIRYNDKNNFYKPALEYVEDVDSIRKYGVRETEVTAFGCTSKAQAIRLGRWILHTNNYEQETVSFAAGVESLLIRPGDLIRIADKNRGLNLQGGRAVDINQTGVFLDRIVNIENSVDYSLTLTNPTYFYDSEQISSDPNFDSEDAEEQRKPQINKIDFTTSSAGFAFSTGVVGTGINGPISGTVIKFPDGSIPASYNANTGLAWSLDDNIYEPEYYNVLDIRDGSDLRYEIVASKHYSGKFAAIESGITFTPRDPSLLGTAAPPPAPTGLSASLASLTTNSKKISYSIGCPSDLGTTSYYDVFAKTGAAFTTSDFITNTTPAVPKNDLKIKRVPAIPGTTTLSSDYIPPVNNTGYYLLAQAYNTAGVPSSSYATSSVVDVTNHFPIKDVSIHSLRLTSDNATNTTVTKNAGVGGVIYPNSKDQSFTWEVGFENGTPPIELDYRVTVRSPVSDSSLQGVVLQGWTGVQSRTFDFPFTTNRTQVPGGPFRHYDIAVEARDKVNGGYSTDGSNNPTAGYDIAEVHNLRPTGYWLTPRHYLERGARPGPCQGYEDLCTEQIITSDGKIRVLLRQFGAQFNDIVGGNIYLSAKPFSTGDFSYATGANAVHSPLGGLTGVPDNTRRYNTFGATTSAEQNEYKITTIPFVDTVRTTECTSSNGCSSNGMLLQNNTIIATANFDTSDPLNLSFDRALHMAISFFDSFDYAVSGAGGTNWNDGQWVGFARPYVHSTNATRVLSNGETQQNLGYYTGCSNADPATCTAGSTDSSGVYTNVLTEEDYIARPTQVVIAPYFTGSSPERSRYTGYSGCPVYLSKFTSAAGLSPYHAWVRINVNGHWEGNGIQSVKLMTALDVDSYYNFNGFFEYSCDYYEVTSNNLQYPNHSDAFTACRFTRGRRNSSNTMAELFKNNALSSADTLTGRRVGVPLFWQSGYMSGAPGNPYVAGSLTTENLTSYNETGAPVSVMDSPSITATRPKHGFRRFRVYFDENNLPPASSANSLAGYSIVGMNAWNGKYESWPGSSSSSQTNSLMFAREGTEVFSTTTVQNWLNNGDVFENIPGVWNHHPAGFGQGYGGLIKTQKYFDIHMGRLIDDSYLEEALFAAVTTTDYSIKLNTVDTGNWTRYDSAMDPAEGYYVASADQGYAGLGLSNTEITALSGWYKADGPTRGWDS